MARVFLGHFSEDEGIHCVGLVANNRVNQESDEETDSSEKRKGNENILEDGEENEREQNDYENGIEDNVVLSNDEQNVTNTEKHGEKQEESQQQQQQQQHEEEQQDKEQHGEGVAQEVAARGDP